MLDVSEIRNFYVNLWLEMIWLPDFINSIKVGILIQKCDLQFLYSFEKFRKKSYEIDNGRYHANHIWAKKCSIWVTCKNPDSLLKVA